MVIRSCTTLTDFAQLLIFFVPRLSQGMELDVPDEAEAEDDALDLSLPDGALTPQMEAVGLATADKLAVRSPSPQRFLSRRLPGWLWGCVAGCSWREHAEVDADRRHLLRQQLVA